MTFKKLISNISFKCLLGMMLITLNSEFAFSQNQFVFRITNVPEYTPQNDTLFLCTSLDNWAVHNQEMRFVKLADGTYFLTFKLEENRNFEYKINRGSWNSVEGNDIGEYLPNRNFVLSSNIFDLKIKVDSWQDLHKIYIPSVDIYVTSIPSSTPNDARLFITGSFNGWTQDPNLELIKLKDGRYHGAVKAGMQTFEFKITRGSWETVEARWDGGQLSNRVYKAKIGQKNDLYIKIASWEDLSPGPYWKMLLFLFFAIQGLQLFGLLYYFKYSKMLVALLILITLAFLFRFGYNYQGLFIIFPYGYLLPACVYAFIGAWMYNWLIKTYNIDIKSKRMILPVILPFFSIILLVLSANIPIFNIQNLDISRDLDIYFLILYIFALGLNLFYGIKSLRYIKQNYAAIPNWTVKLFKVLNVNWYFAICIGILFSLTSYLKLDTLFIKEWIENFFWIAIGVTIIYLDWVLLARAKILTIRQLNTKNPPEVENWDTYKKKLTQLMTGKTLYSDPELSLSDLAKHLGTNTYYVSKILNDGFGKNFADYVNSYRINAFIQAIKNDSSKGKNYLSVAYDIGFNSKSAFNRAFKKHMGCTPSDYFKSSNNQIGKMK